MTFNYGHSDADTSLPEDLRNLHLMPLPSSDGLGSQMDQMRNEDSSLFPSHNQTNEIYGGTAATNSMGYDSLATVQQTDLMYSQVNFDQLPILHPSLIK